MFTIGQTELILPTGWEYRCTRSLGLASVFCNTLINLGGVQVEYNQILIIMDDGKVTITIEIDAELLAQVTEVLKSYGLTPEEAAVQFFKYCADPKTQDHAIKLLKRWKEEQEVQERNSANAK